MKCQSLGGVASNGHTRRVRLQHDHNGVRDNIHAQLSAQFDPDLQPLVWYHRTWPWTSAGDLHLQSEQCHVKLTFSSALTVLGICILCFNTVGWASATAFNLQEMEKTRMALSRAHTSAKAGDLARLNTG